jgi:hypothetical protein
MKYSVYEIWSDGCDGVYVGRTKMPETRWKAHCAMAKHGHAPLYAAMQKFGTECFRFVVVETFETRLESAAAEVWRIHFHIQNGRTIFNRNTGSSEISSKSIFVRPKQGTALQRIVDQARDTNAPLSPIIHEMAVAHERAERRKAKKGK